MQTIRKYELKQEVEQEIDLPAKAKILSVNAINSKLFISAVVDLDHVLTEKRKFRILGDNWEIEKINGRYIGTVNIHIQANSTDLTFHIFEI